MWGMPITVAIVEPLFSGPYRAPQVERGADGFGDFVSVEPYRSSGNTRNLISQVFNYFEYIDETFSTYRADSEISLINQGLLAVQDASPNMRAVFDLAETMRQETNGYFDIAHDGQIDPSGLVKGWALSNATGMLCKAGCENFYVEAGGDFQAIGLNVDGEPWRVGIRNPFKMQEIVKVLAVSDRGVATSGTYIRGQHIYNPVTATLADEILSMTVIGPDVYQADCYATAAFAMGRAGIQFIESLEGFEGYMIDHNKQATFTSGFNRYVSHENHR